MKPQSCMLEIKELLETHLDQLNLQLKRWRPRNVVEHSPSSPTAIQTSAIWGGGGGVPFRGCWVRPFRLPAPENSLSYLTECVNLEDRNLASASHGMAHKIWTHYRFTRGGKDPAAISHLQVKAGSLCRRQREAEYGAWSVFSKEKAGKWQNPKKLAQLLAI